MDRSTSADNNVRDRVNKQRPLNSIVFGSHQATRNQLKIYFDQKRRMKKNYFQLFPLALHKSVVYIAARAHEER